MLKKIFGLKKKEIFLFLLLLIYLIIYLREERLHIMDCFAFQITEPFKVILLCSELAHLKLNNLILNYIQLLLG